MWKGTIGNKEIEIEIKNKNEKYMVMKTDKSEDRYLISILGDAWWMENNPIYCGEVSYICCMNYVPNEEVTGAFDYYQGIIQFTADNEILLSMNLLSENSVLQGAEFVVLKKQ